MIAAVSIEFVLIKLVLAAFVLIMVLNFAGLHTWIERKQSALIQDRIGANRASIFGFRLMGLFHPLADAIKMLALPPPGRRDQDVLQGRPDPQGS